MRLPNVERAVVDIAKLRDYCLNTEHPRGKHKARVFQRTLGITWRDAAWLRMQLLTAAQVGQASLGEHDVYGQRYSIDMVLATPAGTAMVRSSWILRTGEDTPRLTTCYVL